MWEDIVNTFPLTDPLLVVGVLCLLVALTEILCRRTFFKHFGTALLVIIVTAIVANLGIIPTTPKEAPVYGLLTGDIVQLAIFWLLLQVNLRALLKAGGPMISMFLVGSVGTFIGVMLGMFIVGGPTHFGSDHIGLGAMFTATYVGGSVNFYAMANDYHISDSSGIFLGAVVVDNIFTAVWMVVCIAVPRGMNYLRGRRVPIAEAHDSGEAITGVEHDTETIHPLDLGLVIALGVFAVKGSEWISAWFHQFKIDDRAVEVPSMLFLTVFALVLAQFSFVQKLRGTRALGMFAVYLFLATIGALCDIEALHSLEQLGLRLFLFVLVLITVHGVITFGLGNLFRLDRDIVAVASQANIGGGTSALAVARSLGRADLVLPAILVGSLGTGLGNFMGYLTGSILKMMAQGSGP